MASMALPHACWLYPLRPLPKGIECNKSRHEKGDESKLYRMILGVASSKGPIRNNATAYYAPVTCFGGGTFILIWIVFGCKYSFRPSGPLSRPMPDCFQPPKGVAGLVLKAELMPTVPASSLLAMRRARAMSEV